jgi:superfamily II DNA/RNA helicase
LQVVALIRVLLLKRLESSVVAFRDTCENLLLKLYSFIEQHDEGTAQRWLDQNNDLFNLILNNKDFETEEDDAILPEELRFEWEKLDEKKFNVSKIVMDTLLDLKELVDFLNDLENFDFKKDDKIQALIKLLQTDEDLKQEKVIIFTEFMSTAKYLEKTLKDNNFQDLLEIDSSFNGDRGQVIKRFSPFYNKTSVNELKEKGLLEIRILIATDVLSEGINLQDARLLINYDLHWNPVRLMQRIGRVDRRMDSKLEDKIKLQYPHLASKRGIAKYWNFLPPDELNEILSLYQKVTNKTLRISKVFGIENKKLLTGYDDYEALKDFNHEYEGETSKGEEIKLLYQKILADEPSIEEKLNAFPLRVFSGKESVKPDTKGVFLCYRLPINLKKSDETTKWSLNEGITSWYFYEIGKKVILEDFIEINAIISCENEENRIVKFEHESLVEIQKTIKNHIINTYYKASQVPVHDEEGNSLNPVLLSWMEVN